MLTRRGDGSRDDVGGECTITPITGDTKLNAVLMVVNAVAAMVGVSEGRWQCKQAKKVPVMVQYRVSLESVSHARPSRRHPSP